jgi:DNA end-binding protein Ku
VAEQEDDVGPRSFWSGTITFGLVSIPVELFPANRSQRVSLRMVSPDGVPLTRRYFCPKEERELDWDELVRGYEIEKDTFVVVTDEELDKLAPEKTRDIDLRRFVDAEEIDPIYFERAYYLTPGGNSTKAYRLLAATMEQTNKAGMATFVMRGKEYLVAILAGNGILRAETLRFADEVRTAEDVGLPAPEKPKAAFVKQIEKAIAANTAKKLDEKELADRGAERLLELVAKKEKSGADVVAAPEGTDAPPPSDGVIDLMEVLKRSLQGAGGTADGAAADKPTRTKYTRSRASKESSKAGAGKGRAKKAAAKKAATKKTTARSAGRKAAGKAAGRKAPGKAVGRTAASTAPSTSKAALAKESKEALYEMAKDLDIDGRSAMSKGELIEAIRGA